LTRSGGGCTGFLRVVLADHEDDCVAGEGHWLDKIRHFESRIVYAVNHASGARYSRSLHLSSVSVSHCVQERVLRYPVVAATQAVGAGVHRSAESSALDQQHPLGA